MTCGIYKITNKAEGRAYIGKAVDITPRWTRHVTELEAGTHHCADFQNAWSKYGPTSFTFEVLEVCPRQWLSDREYSHIEAAENLYNTQLTAKVCKKRENGVHLVCKSEVVQYVLDHPDIKKAALASI